LSWTDRLRRAMLDLETRFRLPIGHFLDSVRVFGRPFVKRFALCHQTVVCLSCLSCPVCDVRALWPNRWTDQDETWHSGRPPPWPHCVRWGPSSSKKKGHSSHPHFYADVYCGQTSGWTKMSFSTEVCLDPGHIVLVWDPAPLQKRAAQPPIFGPCLLWPNGWMDQDATWYGGRPRPGHIVLDMDPAPPRAPKGAQQ